MHGKEIIEMLKEQGIQINEQEKNTINLIAYEIFTKGKEEGEKEGIKIGINRACREFEVEIGVIRRKAE